MKHGIRRVRRSGNAALLTALFALMVGETHAQSGGSALDNQILQVVSGLRNTANAQTTLLNNLQNSSNNQQTSLNNLQSILNGQQTSLMSLQTSLTALQTAVTSLQSSISNLQTAVNRIPIEPRKRFYLTLTTHDGAHALTACGSGYHMASLWEIFEVSGLRYDRSISDSFTSGDSGMGPSSLGSGWVRTGWRAEDANAAGSANCDTWTSVDAADYGTSIELNNQWDETPVNQNPAINPWRSRTLPCDTSTRVWCKQD